MMDLQMQALLSGGIFAIVIGLVVGAIGLTIYLIPTFVACKKKSPKKTAAILLNIFLGWSLIGWIIALVLACKKPEPPATIDTNAYYPPQYPQQQQDYQNQQ